MSRGIKVLFSSNRNPNFETFTDYIEKAFKEIGCEIVFFENRDFIIPWRIRGKFNFLQKIDLKALNKRLLNIAKTFKPDLFLEDGGWNILAETMESMKRLGIKTAMWTNDVPIKFESIIRAAPHYDHVFTTDSGYIELFIKNNIKNYSVLNFACDPDFHKPVILSNEEMKIYGCDISFVGSYTSECYPNRRIILESLTDFDIGVWGPGWENLPDSSPLKRRVRGGHARPEEWVKIYSASKMALCIHYQSPYGMPKTHQATTKVFEIPACGVLLVVDAQKDIMTLLKSGEHLVVYKNVDDLRAKVLYYLNNEDERKTIAENGRREVLEKHTYKHRVETILKTVGLK
ncbi:MAG: glycosyltransferase [Deltaproteobacteria bacterium]|nr:glycosyltransferase [Deltaproteobacteria bacterium]